MEPKTKEHILNELEEVQTCLFCLWNACEEKRFYAGSEKATEAHKLVIKIRNELKEALS